MYASAVKLGQQNCGTYSRGDYKIIEMMEERQSIVMLLNLIEYPTYCFRRIMCKSVFLIRSYGTPNGTGRCSFAQ